MTLFHSRHATVNCFRPGFQAFCCEASTFTALIDACIWTGCKYLPNGKSNPNKSNTTCPAGTVSSASRFDPIREPPNLDRLRFVSINPEQIVDMALEKAPKKIGRSNYAVRQTLHFKVATGLAKVLVMTMSAARKWRGCQYHEFPFAYRLHRTDIQVDRDAFGLGGRCAGGANDREKSLCCKQDLRSRGLRY